MDIQVIRWISMNIEYYTKKSNNIVNQSIALEYGRVGTEVNGGRVVNSGVEYTLNITPIRTKDWAWTIGFNSSKNWNKAKTQSISEISLQDYISGSSDKVLKEGFALSSFWSYDFKRLSSVDGSPEFNRLFQEDAQGNILKGEDGAPLLKGVNEYTDMLVYSGKMEPDFTGGLTTRLRWKGLTFGANFSLLLGAKKRLPNPYPNLGNIPLSNVNLSKDLINRWKKPGDEAYTYIPGVYTGRIANYWRLQDDRTYNMYQMWGESDIMVAKADFLRCQQISLTWTANDKICTKMRVKSFSINAIMNNVFVVADKKFHGFDPELGDSVQPKTYSFLLLVVFITSCNSFLEPKSQSEFVPQLIQSLDELLLGEAYMGPGLNDGRFFSVLGVFDDDVSIRPNWKAESSEEGKVKQIRLAYSWSKDMKDQFSNYNTYAEVYKKILGCNSVLDYMDDVQGSEQAKNKVMAQALALRGYFYLHLVNLYGKPYSADKNALGVPLKLTSEMGTSGMPRNTVKEVYEQIIKDLLEAESLFKSLPASEQNLRNNRINLPCTQLLLSRTYLYMEEWEKSVTYAEEVINQYDYDILDLNTIAEPNPYNSPAYMNYYTWSNPEVIFLFGNQADVCELPLTRITCVEESKPGQINYKSYVPVIASESLINTFDKNDLRKTHYLIWEEIDYNGTPVYRQPTSKYDVQRRYKIEYRYERGVWGTAFKVTEAYLNAAEAAAMLYKENNQSEYRTKAQTLIDALRIKRFSQTTYKPTTISEGEQLVSFIRDERRRELCFENHRWFDLRRYGMEEIKHTWYDTSGEPIEYILEKNDPGFTLQLPNEAFEHNSSLVQNEPRK